MECGNTSHSVISIWIQTWIWIQSMVLHGVWRHFTFHNIHMDTDMAPCLHIITATYFRYQIIPIQNSYHIIYHNSRILNIHPRVARKWPFQDKDTFIDSYCLLHIDYVSFHLSLLWVDSVLYINCHSTWSVGTPCTL